MFVVYLFVLHKKLQADLVKFSQFFGLN